MFVLADLERCLPESGSIYCSSTSLRTLEMLPSAPEMLLRALARLASTAGGTSPDAHVFAGAAGPVTVGADAGTVTVVGAGHWPATVAVWVVVAVEVVVAVTVTVCAGPVGGGVVGEECELEWWRDDAEVCEKDDAVLLCDAEEECDTEVLFELPEVGPEGAEVGPEGLELGELLPLPDVGPDGLELGELLPLPEVGPEGEEVGPEGEEVGPEGEEVGPEGEEVGPEGPEGEEEGGVGVGSASIHQLKTPRRKTV